MVLCRFILTYIDCGVYQVGVSGVNLVLTRTAKPENYHDHAFGTAPTSKRSALCAEVPVRHKFSDFESC